MLCAYIANNKRVDIQIYIHIVRICVCMQCILLGKCRMRHHHDPTPKTPAAPERHQPAWRVCMRVATTKCEWRDLNSLSGEVGSHFVCSAAQDFRPRGWRERIMEGERPLPKFVCAQRFRGFLIVDSATEDARVWVCVVVCKQVCVCVWVSVGAHLSLIHWQTKCEQLCCLDFVEAYVLHNLVYILIIARIIVAGQLWFSSFNNHYCNYYYLPFLNLCLFIET